MLKSDLIYILHTFTYIHTHIMLARGLQVDSVDSVDSVGDAAQCLSNCAGSGNNFTRCLRLDFI